MKKLLIAFCAVLFAIVSMEAQAPQAFKYQAIARDGAGNILSNQDISLRISILQGSVDGPVIFSEVHHYSTNEFGLINLEIGNGEARVGSLPEVDWAAGALYLNLEMDNAGGSDYKYIGTAQLLSVPYALYAAETGSTMSRAGEWDNDATNIYVHSTYAANRVGIGTTTPGGKLHIYGTGWAGPPEPMLLIEHKRGYTTAFRRIIDSPGNALFLLQKARGTLALPTAVQNGDQIGQIRMEGYDGTNWAYAGNIIVKADGPVSAGIVPGALFFQTADNSGTLNEHMRITSTGNVGIGTLSPGYKLDVTGDVNATNYYKGGTLLKEGQWLVSGSDIYYNTGNVSIGSTPFTHDRLHIHTNNSSTSSAGINSVHGYTGTNSVFGIIGKISNTASGIGLSGAGVSGSSSGLTGNGAGVSGWAAADQGIGVYSSAAHATGVNYGIYATTLSPNGYAGYFVGGKNYFQGNVGIGSLPSASNKLQVYINGSASAGVSSSNAYTGTSWAFGVEGTINSTGFGLLGNSGAGVIGKALGVTGKTIGVQGYSGADMGAGVYAEAGHATGVNYGIYAKTLSSNGYAGYFVGGKNYFQGNVGIGTTTPGYKLDVTGNVNATNYYVGGSLVGIWKVSGSSVYYDSGNVGIGTSPGASKKLHVYTNSSNSHGVYSINAYSGSSNAIGVEGYISSIGIGIGICGAGVFGQATGATGNTAGVQGNSSADKGAGVYAEASHTTGVNYGIYAKTLSSNGYAGYFIGPKSHFQGNVGIGILAPTNKLHVSVFSVLNNPQVRVDNTNTGDASIRISQQSEEFTLGIDASDSDNFEIANKSTLTGGIYQDGYTRFRIHNASGSKGIVDQPYESRGRAYLSGSQSFINPGPYPPTPPSWMPIAFDVTSYDQHGEWTLLSGGSPNSFFTATEEGYYQVNARTELFLQEFELVPDVFPPGTYASIAIFVNQSIYAQGNNLQITQNAYPGGVGEFVTFVLPFNNAPNVSDVVYLSAGDVVEICVTISNVGPPVLIMTGSYVTYASIHKVS